MPISRIDGATPTIIQDPLLNEKNIDALISSIEEENLGEFTKVIQNIDVDGYFDYEGIETLISSFLFGFFTNPGIENGQEFIDVVLAKKPNLELPIALEGDPETIKDMLKALKEDFLKEMSACEPQEKEFINIIIARMDTVLNHS